MNRTLKDKFKESVAAVLPITVLVLVISMIVVPIEVGNIMMFLMGAVVLILGMSLFQLGAEVSMTPLGEGIGVQLSKSKKMIIVLIVSFVIGTIITIAEPDLQVLAYQVPSIPNMVLILTVALGVGLMLAVALLRIRFKISLPIILAVLYIALFILSIFVPKDFLPVAFDSGGVTTGPITVPFIMALGVGMAAIRGDKDAASDSFGLVALCSVGPILAVMILGMFYNLEGGAYAAVEVLHVETMRDVLLAFVQALPHYAIEVLISILPIVAVMMVFQLISKRFHRRQFVRMVIGFVYTYIGLVLFLTAVNVGFSSVGSLLGGDLAKSSFKWLLIPIGMLIGYFIVKAEPAVQVLNRQVENVTEGTIPKEAMNRSLSIGIAIAVGLAMLRVLTGISIYWIIVPGYAISLIMTKFVPKIFVGIAFDSGGVASGPMTTTFLLPLAIGASEALGGNVMADAFGAVAMVALTPLIAVQLMGLLYVRRVKATALSEVEAIELGDDDEIVELIEEDEDDA